MRTAFHLYYPDEPSARRAAAALEGQGYGVEVRPGADGARWLVVAASDLAGAAFDAAEHRMAAFAGTTGGTFDGYEEGG